MLNEFQEVLSSPAAAAFLGVSAVQLCRDRHRGVLGGVPFVRLGGRVVYRSAALRDWLAQREQRAPESAPPAASRAGAPTKAERLAAAGAGLSVPAFRAAQRAKLAVGEGVAS